MPLFHSRHSKTTALGVAIFVIGTIAGVINYRLHWLHASNDLMHEAAAAAAAFDASELRQLSASHADEGTPVYQGLKARLKKLHFADPNIRYIYIFRAEATKPVVFLADSMAVDPNDELHPGDVYGEEAQSHQIASVLGTGRPAFAGPLHDANGSWITGYALITDANASGVRYTPR